MIYENDHFSSLLGVDVSHHQGKIDWDKVKADGYDFVMWQYTSRGTVDGIKGSVDLNIQFMEK